MLIDFHNIDSSIEFLKTLFELDTFTKNMFINEQSYLDSELHVTEKTFDEFKRHSLVTYHITKCNSDDIIRNGLLPLSQVISNKESEISKLLTSKNIKLDMEKKILNFSHECISLDYKHKPVRSDVEYEYLSLCRRVERDNRVDCFYSKPFFGNDYSVIDKTPEILFDIGKITNTYSFFEQTFFHSKLKLVIAEMKLSDANIEESDMIQFLDDLLEYIFSDGHFDSPFSVISTKTGVRIHPKNILHIEPINIKT